MSELLAAADSAELTEWMAYCQLEMEPAPEPDQQNAWRKAFNAYG